MRECEKETLKDEETDKNPPNWAVPPILFQVVWDVSQGLSGHAFELEEHRHCGLTSYRS